MYILYKITSNFSKFISLDFSIVLMELPSSSLRIDEVIRTSEKMKRIGLLNMGSTTNYCVITIKKQTDIEMVRPNSRSTLALHQILESTELIETLQSCFGKISKSMIRSA